MSTASNNNKNPAEKQKVQQRKSTHYYERRQKYKKDKLQPDIDSIRKIVDPSECKYSVRYLMLLLFFWVYTSSAPHFSTIMYRSHFSLFSFFFLFFLKQY